MCVCVRMDRIVEINLVQSDWLCWLKLKQARVCVCVEHSGESRGEGERGKHGLGSYSQHGYSGSPYSALFHPPAQAAGDTTVRKNRLIFCQ